MVLPAKLSFKTAKDEKLPLIVIDTIVLGSGTDKS